MPEIVIRIDIWILHSHIINTGVEKLEPEGETIV